MTYPRSRHSADEISQSGARYPRKALGSGTTYDHRPFRPGTAFRRPRRELAAMSRSLRPGELDRPPLRAERAHDGVFEAAAHAAPCRGVEDDVRVNQYGLR